MTGTIEENSMQMVLGDIIDAPTDALVNTVNTVGVMGKGVALQFRRAFPDNFKAYKAACDKGQLQPGGIFLWKSPHPEAPRFILNVATKKHWRGDSKLEYVEEGIQHIRRTIQELGIKSIAIPPLGCGNGGLDWADVKTRIIKGLADLKGVDIRLYVPRTEAPREQKIATSRPNLTVVRASLVAAIDSYKEPGYTLGRLEIQKLAYLLQRLGGQMQFDFEKQKYGPYSQGLVHAIDALEGHYVRGLGDLTEESHVQAVPESMGEVRAKLRSEPGAVDLIQKLGQAVTGFDSPYGLELLTSVDWVVAHREADPEDVTSVVSAVHRWNARKRQLFPERNIKVALARLREVGLAKAAAAA